MSGNALTRAVPSKLPSVLGGMIEAGASSMCSGATVAALCSNL